MQPFCRSVEGGEHSRDQRRPYAALITVLNNICPFWTVKIMPDSKKQLQVFNETWQHIPYHALLWFVCILVKKKKSLLDRNVCAWYLPLAVLSVIQFNFVVSFRKPGTYVVDDNVWLCKIHQVTSYKITAGSISIINSVSTLSFLRTTCHFIDKYALYPHTLHSRIQTASMH